MKRRLDTDTGLGLDTVAIKGIVSSPASATNIGQARYICEGVRGSLEHGIIWTIYCICAEYMSVTV